MNQVNIERLNRWLNQMIDEKLEAPIMYEKGNNDFKNVVVRLDNYISEKQEMNQADYISFSEFFKKDEWFKICKDEEKKAMIELFVLYIGARKVMELTIEYLEDDSKLYILDYLVEHEYISIEEMIGFMIYLVKNERNDLIDLKNLYLSKVSKSDLEIENVLLKKAIKNQQDLIKRLARMSGCDSIVHCIEYDKYTEHTERSSYPL